MTALESMMLEAEGREPEAVSQRPRTPLNKSNKVSNSAEKK